METIVCEQCGRSFKTVTGRAWHIEHLHGQKEEPPAGEGKSEAPVVFQWPTHILKPETPLGQAMLQEMAKQGISVEPPTGQMERVKTFYEQADEPSRDKRVPKEPLPETSTPTIPFWRQR